MAKKEINEETQLITDYKKYMKLLRQQRKMGIINKSEYSYFKTYYILHLTDK